jgi:hypothetical protein
MPDAGATDLGTFLRVAAPMSGLEVGGVVCQLGCDAEWNHMVHAVGAGQAAQPADGVGCEDLCSDLPPFVSGSAVGLCHDLSLPVDNFRISYLLNLLFKRFLVVFMRVMRVTPACLPS